MTALGCAAAQCFDTSSVPPRSFAAVQVQRLLRLRCSTVGARTERYTVMHKPSIASLACFDPRTERRFSERGAGPQRGKRYGARWGAGGGGTPHRSWRRRRAAPEGEGVTPAVTQAEMHVRFVRAGRGRLGHVGALVGRGGVQRRPALVVLRLQVRPRLDLRHAGTATLTLSAAPWPHSLHTHLLYRVPCCGLTPFAPRGSPPGPPGSWKDDLCARRPLVAPPPPQATWLGGGRDGPSRGRVPGPLGSTTRSAAA